MIVNKHNFLILIKKFTSSQSRSTGDKRQKMCVGKTSYNRFNIINVEVQEDSGSGRPKSNDPVEPDLEL